MKNLESKVSGIVLNDVDLLSIWRTLTGALFLPLINPEVLHILKSYLKNKLKLLVKKIQLKQKSFRFLFIFTKILFF